MNFSTRRKIVYGENQDINTFLYTEKFFRKIKNPGYISLYRKILLLDKKILGNISLYIKITSEDKKILFTFLYTRKMYLKKEK